MENNFYAIDLLTYQTNAESRFAPRHFPDMLRIKSNIFRSGSQYSNRRQWRVGGFVLFTLIMLGLLLEIMIVRQPRSSRAFPLRSLGSTVMMAPEKPPQLEAAHESVQAQLTEVDGDLSPVPIPRTRVHVLVTGDPEINHILTFGLYPYEDKFTYHIDYGDGHKQIARAKNRHSYHRSGDYHLTIIVLYGRDTVDVNPFTLHIRPTVSVNAKSVKNHTPSSNSSVMPRDVAPRDAAEREVRIVDHGNWDDRRREAVSGPLMAAEKMPSYPGGEQALKRFLAQALNYPKEAREHNIEGQVVVQFVVETDGRLTNLNIIKGLDHGCDTAVLHALARMPRWIPGEHEGRIMPVYYTLPINFQLKGN